MKLVIIFTVLSLVNVVFSTIRSITTIKCGRNIASIISALYFSYYNIVLIYTVADFPLWEKCVITAVCNFVGVWIVKTVEDKMRKDRLWVITATCKVENSEMGKIAKSLKEMGIKLVYNEVIHNSLYSMQIFANTQKETSMIKSILENYNVKYCAYETQDM